MLRRMILIGTVLLLIVVPLTQELAEANILDGTIAGCSCSVNCGWLRNCNVSGPCPCTCTCNGNTPVCSCGAGMGF